METSGNSEFDQWLATLPELVPEDERITFAQHIADVDRQVEERLRTINPTEEVAKIIARAATSSSRATNDPPKKQPS